MTDSMRRLESEVIACRRCPRLVTHRENVARVKRRAYAACEYWGRPVPGFGDPGARLVVVGLAPGAHGANRTGRMFTGDSSGDFLFAALHRFGFASQPASTHGADGLRLDDCRITAVARCAPPGNQPTRVELAACRPFLVRELKLLKRTEVFVALGRIAFDNLMRALAEIGRVPAAARPPVTPRSKVRPRPSFVHGAEYAIDARLRLLCSYHPSRQNTQTGRLTRAMFHAVFRRARRILDGG
jgi:uracil-DNA glycosylase family 4